MAFRSNLTALVVASFAIAFPGLNNASERDTENEEQYTPIFVTLPPDGLPIEKWEFIYDDCRCLLWEDLAESQGWIGCVRPIDVVVDGNDIYMRGLSSERPQIWIKGNLRGDILSFDKGVVSYTDWTVYGHYQDDWCLYPAYFKYEWFGGHTYMDFRVMATYEGDVLRCVYNHSQNVYEAEIPSTVEDEPYGFVIQSARYDSAWAGWGYSADAEGNWGDCDPPENYDIGRNDLYLNVAFRRQDPAAIEDVMDDRSDDDIYDLSGSKLKPENLSPGIYIRNGKKFVYQSGNRR